LHADSIKPEVVNVAADDFFMLQPNIMGIGVNFNKLPQLVKKLFKKKPG
jgi:hypothetical protein